MAAPRPKNDKPAGPAFARALLGRRESTDLHDLAAMLAEADDPPSGQRDPLRAVPANCITRADVQRLCDGLPPLMSVRIERAAIRLAAALTSRDALRLGIAGRDWKAVLRQFEMELLQSVVDSIDVVEQDGSRGVRQVHIDSDGSRARARLSQGRVGEALAEFRTAVQDAAVFQAEAVLCPDVISAAYAANRSPKSGRGQGSAWDDEISQYCRTRLPPGGWKALPDKGAFIRALIEWLPNQDPEGTRRPPTSISAIYGALNRLNIR